MKIIETIFSIFLALILIAGAGLFILFQTFDTSPYLPEITQKISSVLGRQVAIGHLGLGLSLNGMSMDVEDITIADDPAFTDQPFVEVDRVRIVPQLWSLIVHRKIHIREIILQSPQIHIIRSRQGGFNIQSLGQKNHSVKEALPTANSQENKTQDLQAAAKESPSFSAFPINFIKIQDAAVSYIDQSQALPLDIWLNGINLRLRGFSLSSPFQLSGKAYFYSNAPNVHVGGLVSLDLSKQTMAINDLRFTADFSKLDIERVKYISPDFFNSPILKDVTGMVQFNIGHLDISPAAPFKATGDLSITDGRIKDFNIIKTLFSRTVGVFGGMGFDIDHLLSSQPKLNGQDTIIQKIQMQFLIHDNTLFIDDASIQTDVFELTAKGSMDRGLNVDLQTMLYLNEDVSSALVNQFKGMHVLYDNSQRIAIDASLKGVVPHLKYKPNKDFKKRIRKALMQEGGNILSVLLGV